MVFSCKMYEFKSILALLETHNIGTLLINSSFIWSVNNMQHPWGRGTQSTTEEPKRFVGQKSLDSDKTLVVWNQMHIFFTLQ